MEIVDRRVPLSEIGKTVGPAPIPRFVENVRRNGVIVPILLRETVSGEGVLLYRVVDGNRRVAAARSAGFEDIQARVLLGASADDAAILVFISNNFRSANDITEYLAIKHLERAGVNRIRIAEAAGMTLNSLDLRGRWSHLDRRIFTGLAEGKITASVATSIARMKGDDQRYFGDMFARKDRVLAADVREFLRDRKSPPPVRLQHVPAAPPLTVNLAPVEKPASHAPRPDGLKADMIDATSGPFQETVGHLPGHQSIEQTSSMVPSEESPVASTNAQRGHRPAGIPSPPIAETRSEEPTRPIAALLTVDVQQVIEQVANLGYTKGYSLADLTDALAIAYRQVAFVEKTFKEETRG